jgi:hypothetical protein
MTLVLLTFNVVANVNNNLNNNNNNNNENNLNGVSQNANNVATNTNAANEIRYLPNQTEDIEGTLCIHLNSHSATHPLKNKLFSLSFFVNFIEKF